MPTRSLIRGRGRGEVGSSDRVFLLGIDVTWSTLPSQRVSVDVFVRRVTAFDARGADSDSDRTDDNDGDDEYEYLAEIYRFLGSPAVGNWLGISNRVYLS